MQETGYTVKICNPSSERRLRREGCWGLLASIQPGQGNFSLRFREWRGGRSPPSPAPSVLRHRCVSVQRDEHTTLLQTQTAPQISDDVCLFVYVPVGTGHGANVETTGQVTCRCGSSPPPCGSRELSLGSLHLGGKHLHASPNLRILKSLSAKAQNQGLKTTGFPNSPSSGVRA